MFRGAVGFSRSKGWLSKMILFFRRLPHPDAKFSHTFRCIGQIDGIDMCISAEPSGICLMTLEKQISGNKNVEIWYPPTDYSKTETMIEGMIKTVGEAYSYSGILGMIKVTIFDWLGKKVENTYEKNEICSESVHQSLVGPYGNIDLNSSCSADLITYDKDSIAPDDIYRAIVQDKMSVKVAFKKFGEKELTLK